MQEEFGKGKAIILWSGITSSFFVLLFTLFVYNSVFETATLAQVLQTPFGGVVGKSFKVTGRYDSSAMGVVLVFIFCFLFSISFFFLLHKYRVNKYFLPIGIAFGCCLSLITFFIIRPITGWEKASWSLDYLSLVMFAFFVGLPNAIINKYFN